MDVGIALPLSAATSTAAEAEAGLLQSKPFLKSRCLLMGLNASVSSSKVKRKTTNGSFFFEH